MRITPLCLQQLLSAEQKETALKKLPSLLEMAGHAYFFGGFLVGPQVGDICILILRCT